MISGIKNPDLWLAAFGAAVAAGCFNCDWPVAPANALILLLGIGLGKAARLSICRLPAEPCARLIRGALLAIAGLLTVGIYHDSDHRIYRYHDELRWSGMWDSPNTFGLLMGTGITLSLGVLILNRARTRSQAATPSQGPEARPCDHGLFLALETGAFATAAGCMGMGLFRSYSRGAWLATLCGAICLWWNRVDRDGKRGSPRVSRIAIPLCIIGVSASLLLFWHSRQTRWAPVRRVFSAVSTVDLSSRNRVAALEGALQIMAEHPWFGAGWNRPEALYEHYYLPASVNESGAIQTNDYLMLGASLGIPGLLCFGMYVWLALRQRVDVQCPKPALGSWTLDSLRSTCHAGAIVLLIGFGFNSGLSKITPGLLFWILLELGRPPSCGRNVETCGPE